MKKACKESDFITNLESNTIYLGKSNKKYKCPQGLCAERGSQMYPVSNLKEAFDILNTRYTIETPVGISVSAGSYSYDDDSKNGNPQIPINLVSIICPNGEAEISGMNWILNDHPKLVIDNIDILGDVHVSSMNQGSVNVFQHSHGKLLGKYNVSSRNEGNQTFILENIEQIINKLRDDGTDNIVKASGNGILNINVNGGSKTSFGKSLTEATDKGEIKADIEDWLVNDQGCIMNLLKNGKLSQKIRDSKFVKSTLRNMGGNYVTLNAGDNSEGTMESSNTQYESEQPEGTYLFNMLAQGASKILDNHNNLKSIISGGGGIIHNEIKDNANVKREYRACDMKCNTHNDIQTELSTPYSKEILRDKAKHIIEVIGSRLEAPFQKNDRQMFNDSHRDCIMDGCRTTSSGSVSKLFDNSSLEKKTENNSITDGSIGSYWLHTLEGSSNVNIRHLNQSSNLSNLILPSARSGSIEQCLGNTKIVASDNSKYSMGSDGSITIWKLNPCPSSTVRQVTSLSAQTIEQSGTSSVSRNINNGRTELIGSGGLIKTILTDSANHSNKESAHDIIADITDKAASLLEHNVSGSAKLQNSGTNVSVTQLGGLSVVKKDLSDLAEHVEVSRGANIMHSGQNLQDDVKTFLINLKDKAKYDETETGGIFRSSGFLKNVVTDGESLLQHVSTNSILQAIKGTYEESKGKSNITNRIFGSQHFIDKVSRGNVRHQLAQVEQEGLFDHDGGDSVRGELRLTGGRNNGLLKLKNTKIFSNNHEMINENSSNPALFAENTDNDHVFSKFIQNKDSPVMHIISDRPDTRINLKTSDMIGSDDNTVPIMRTQGTFGKFKSGLVTSNKTNYLEHDGPCPLILEWANNHNDPDKVPLTAKNAKSFQRSTGIQFL